MKCILCPCQVENSNEIDGYQPNGCFYGDDYLDDIVWWKEIVLPKEPKENG